MAQGSQDIQASVIMSEYNTDLTKLKNSIQSIVDQTFKNFELIIVDDCGSNDISSVVDSFNDSRIRVLRNVRNMGLPFSLNRAIQESKSDFLIRMDTDDIAHPDRLQLQVEFLKSHPEYAAVGTRAYHLSNNVRVGIHGEPGEKTATQIMRGRSPIHPTVIMNKKSVMEVGGYPERNRAEDLALWCELLLADFRIYVMEDILLDYRVDHADYGKRALRHRGGEIETRLYYYPKLHAGFFDYLRIVKSVIAGLTPINFMSAYQKKFVVRNLG